MRSLLHHRDFRLLLAGQATSMLGDWLLVLVLGMWAKQLTGSTTIAGTVLLAGAVPSLAAPLGGWLADRVRRRRLMVAVDAAAGIAVASLVLVHGRSQLWLLYAVAGATGVARVAFAPAVRGLVHQLVPTDALGAANGVLTTVRQALRLVGPLAGAALFAAVGGGTVALLDTATFVVSIATVLALHHRQTRPEPRTLTLRDDVAAGIRHLRGHLLLRRMTAASILTMGALGCSESVFFAVLDGLGKPVTYLGVVTTVQGVGAIAVGATLTVLVGRLGEVRVLTAALGVATVAALAVDSHAVAGVLVGAFLFGAALPALIIATTTVLQRHTPNPIMGRASAAFDLATGLPYTLAIGASALLLAVVSYRVVLLGMAAGLAAATVYAWVRLPDVSGHPSQCDPVAATGSPA